MRMFLTGIVLLASMTLAGCAGSSATAGGTGAVEVGVPGVSVTVGDKVTSTINQVQAIVKSTCSFLPAATTVASIVDALGGGGTASVVAQAAGAICSAVNRAGASRSGVRVTPVARVGGKRIPVRGNRV